MILIDLNPDFELDSDFDSDFDCNFDLDFDLDYDLTMTNISSDIAHNGWVCSFLIGCELIILSIIIYKLSIMDIKTDM